MRLKTKQTKNRIGFVEYITVNGHLGSTQTTELLTSSLIRVPMVE